MSDDNTPAFRTTMRGYEPEAVDKYIAQLAGAVGTARRRPLNWLAGSRSWPGVGSPRRPGRGADLRRPR